MPAKASHTHVRLQHRPPPRFPCGMHVCHTHPQPRRFPRSHPQPRSQRKRTDANAPHTPHTNNTTNNNAAPRRAVCATPGPARRGPSRVSSEAVFEAVAQLTGLMGLRMAVYANADHDIPCHLSRLAALSALQRFSLEKRRCGGAGEPREGAGRGREGRERGTLRAFARALVLACAPAYGGRGGGVHVSAHCCGLA